MTPPPTSTYSLFFFNDTATTEIYTLSLHDALPIYRLRDRCDQLVWRSGAGAGGRLLVDRAVLPELDVSEDVRSEEHTSELQSRRDLVCRLLLEKKKKKKQNITY